MAAASWPLPHRHSRRWSAARALWPKVLLALFAAGSVLGQEEVILHDGPGNVYSVQVITEGVLRARPTFSASGTHVFASIARDVSDEDRGNVAQECTGDSCSALGVVDSSVNGTACFEATLGRMKWQGAPGCNAGTNSPVVDGDSVYQACTYDPVAPSAGGLFRLAQDTGAVQWRWPAEGVVGENAARIQGMTDTHIVITTGPYADPVCGNGAIRVLNKADGSEVYKVPQPWAVATGVIDGDVAYMGMHCGDVVALNVTSGAAIWSQSWSGREPLAIAATSLVLDGDMIYVGMSGAVRALDKARGDLVWSWYDPKGATVNAGPTLVRIPGRDTEEPLVIFGTDAGQVITLQAQKQASAGSADLLPAETSWAPAVIWSYQKDTSTLDIGSTAQFSVPSVDLASQTIFLGSWDGFILKFDLLSGDQAPDVWYGAGATAGIAVGVDRLYFIKGQKMYVNELPDAIPTGDPTRPAASPRWHLDLAVTLSGFQSTSTVKEHRAKYVDALMDALRESAGAEVALDLVGEEVRVDIADAPSLAPAPPLPVTTVRPPPSSPSPSQTRRMSRRLLAGGSSNSEFRVAVKARLREGGDITREDGVALQGRIVDTSPPLIMSRMSEMSVEAPGAVAVAAVAAPSTTADDRAGTPPAIKSEDSVPTWVFAVAGAAGLAVIALLAALVCCLCRRRRRSALQLEATNPLATSVHGQRSLSDKGSAASPTDPGPLEVGSQMVTTGSEGKGSFASSVLRTNPSALHSPRSVLAYSQTEAAEEERNSVSNHGQLLTELAARSAGLPPPAMRLRRVSLQICALLDERLETNNSMWSDKWVLTTQRSIGPQSVINGVDGAYGGTFFAKFYCNKSLFANELRLYQMPRMKGFFSDVVDMAGTARSVSGSGVMHSDMTLPPHKVTLLGRPLADECLKQRHTLLEVMRVLGQVSLTLEMLHAAGFAHLNVHAGNVIWMEDSSTWAVTDLSSAYELGVSVAMSALGVRTRLAPPEAIVLAESGGLVMASSSSCDAWALGCLGFQLISGASVFPATIAQADVVEMLAGRAPFDWETDPVAWVEVNNLGPLGPSLIQLLSRDPRQRIRVSNVRGLWMHVLKGALANRS